MYRRIYFYFLFSIVIGFSACDPFGDLPAEESLDTWEIFNTSTGLKSNNIWCLLADSKGNIWAGSTDHGLMKYDGEEWTNYSSFNGLSGDYVSALAEYYNGEIWIGTENGFSVYDGTSFKNYTGAGGNVWTVTSIKTLENGDIWIGTFHHGLNHLSGSTVTPYYSSTNSGLNWVTSIDQAEDGTIYAGTWGGLYKIKDSSVKILNRNDGLSSDTVTAVLCDSWGDVWVGNWENEFVTRIEDGKPRKVSLFNSQYSALTNVFTEDKMGNIWMGLISEGVVKYDGITTRSFSVEDGIPGMSILDIEVDTAGCLWFASHYNGIAKYTPIAGN